MVLMRSPLLVVKIFRYVNRLILQGKMVGTHHLLVKLTVMPMRKLSPPEWLRRQSDFPIRSDKVSLQEMHSIPV